MKRGAFESEVKGQQPTRGGCWHVKRTEPKSDAVGRGTTRASRVLQDLPLEGLRGNAGDRGGALRRLRRAG